MEYTISRNTNWWLWVRNSLRPVPITITLLLATLVGLAALASSAAKDMPYFVLAAVIVILVGRAIVTRWPWKKPIIVRFTPSGISYTKYSGEHVFIPWQEIDSYLLEYPASLAKDAPSHGWVKVSHATSWWVAVRANKTNTMGFAHIFLKDGKNECVPALDVHFTGLEQVMRHGVRSRRELHTVPIIERAHYRNTGFLLLAFIPLIGIGAAFGAFGDPLYHVIVGTFILVAIFGATQLIKSLIPAMRCEVVQEYSPQAKMMTGSDIFARSMVYGLQRYVDVAFYLFLGLVVIVAGFGTLYYFFFV